ncbi:MAG: hypothetical protein ABIS17_14940, partial [Casimicrobiaceae bacterium]
MSNVASRPAWRAMPLMLVAAVFLAALGVSGGVLAQGARRHARGVLLSLLPHPGVGVERADLL